MITHGDQRADKEDYPSSGVVVSSARVDRFSLVAINQAAQILQAGHRLR